MGCMYYGWSPLAGHRPLLGRLPIAGQMPANQLLLLLLRKALPQAGIGYTRTQAYSSFQICQPEDSDFSGGYSWQGKFGTVLGIDIGTESVGSAWVDLEASDFDFAVSIFPRGVEEGDDKRGAPKNQARRQARSSTQVHRPAFRPQATTPSRPRRCIGLSSGVRSAL